MSVTVIFDTTAITTYGALGKGALAVGEILAEVADDVTATIGLPVLAVAQAWSLASEDDDELTRLDRLLDPQRSPVAHLPVGAEHGRDLGDLFAVFGDLPRAHAALASMENADAPILTADGDRYRAAGLGLDILDL